jgi:hypothetical protein
MSDTPRIAVRPLPSTTAEQACDVRAGAWAFVFECFNRRNGQEGGPATAPDDAKEIKNVRATPIVSEQS